MPELIHLHIDGKKVAVPPGTTVAAAAAMVGVHALRGSVLGEPRAALCGMGVCFECRASVNGRLHSRTCQLVCEEGMEVTTHAV